MGIKGMVGFQVDGIDGMDEINGDKTNTGEVMRGGGEDQPKRMGQWKKGRKRKLMRIVRMMVSCDDRLFV